MTNTEIKQKAEEACCEIIDFIRGTMPKDEDRDHLYIEIACSFLTLACDMEKDIGEIDKDLRQHLEEIYNISLVGVMRYKSGIESMVVKKFDN